MYLPCQITILTILFFPHREWYTNGDYLVMIVSVAIILPLSLLRNLGKISSLLFLLSEMCAECSE